MLVVCLKPTFERQKIGHKADSRRWIFGRKHGLGGRLHVGPVLKLTYSGKNRSSAVFVLFVVAAVDRPAEERTARLISSLFLALWTV